MMKRFIMTMIAVTALMIAIPSSGWANWSINQIQNNSNKTLALSVPITPGGHTNVAAYLNTRGDVGLSILGSGIIYFQDTGNSPCPGPSWSVKITFKTQVWGFFYDGEGRVNVNIDAAGNPSFTASSGSSRVVVGSGC